MTLYIFIFILASLALVPQTGMEVTAGVIWARKPALAFSLAYTGKMLGSWSCFLVGR